MKTTVFGNILENMTYMKNWLVTGRTILLCTCNVGLYILHDITWLFIYQIWTLKINTNNIVLPNTWNLNRMCMLDKQNSVIIIGCTMYVYFFYFLVMTRHNINLGADTALFPLSVNGNVSMKILKGYCTHFSRSESVTTEVKGDQI